MKTISLLALGKRFREAMHIIITSITWWRMKNWNGIPRQSLAQRFPYFQNGAATLKCREAPGTRLRFFGVLIHAHGANHIILNVTNRFGEKRKGERAVTPRELWRFTRSISFRKKNGRPMHKLTTKIFIVTDSSWYLFGCISKLP